MASQKAEEFQSARSLSIYLSRSFSACVPLTWLPIQVPHGLLDVREKVLVPHWEGLLAPKVKVRGIKVNELRLGGAGRLRAGPGDAVKGHQPLPRNVVDLVFRPLVAQAPDEGVREVLNVSQLGDLLAVARNRDGPFRRNETASAFFSFLLAFSS